METSGFDSGRVEKGSSSGAEAGSSNELLLYQCHGVNAIGVVLRASSNLVLYCNVLYCTELYNNVICCTM